MDEHQKPAFAIFVSGTKQAPLLAPLLYSITKQYPQAQGIVRYLRLSPSEKHLLVETFPHWIFQEVKEAQESTSRDDEQLKLLFWSEVCQKYPEQPVCMLDCRSLLIAPLESILEADSDFYITPLDKYPPVSWGSFIARVGKLGRFVLEEILLSSRSASRSHPAENLLNRLILAAENNHGRFEVEIAAQKISIRSLPQSESGPIVYLHRRWQQSLISDLAVTVDIYNNRLRPIEKLWLQTEQEAANFLTKKLVMKHSIAAYDHFFSLNIPYEERGILHSEMLAVCGLCQALDVDMIIESGRCRGQSTEILARFFENTKTKIMSVELERDENADFAEKRLEPYRNVELFYGDGFKIIPPRIKLLKNKRVAILLDGPKGIPALSFIESLFHAHNNVLAAFVHDTPIETSQRDFLNSGDCRSFCTDDADFLDKFSQLDEVCQPGEKAPIAEYSWRPYTFEGREVKHYGPTLGIMLPRPARPENEIRSAKRLRHAKWASRRARLSRNIKKFISGKKHTDRHAA